MCTHRGLKDKQKKKKKKKVQVGKDGKVGSGADAPKHHVSSIGSLCISLDILLVSGMQGACARMCGSKVIVGKRTSFGITVIPL